MRAQQRTIINELAVPPISDPAVEVESRVQFLADYLRHTGAGGYVLGVSGGLDSTLAGRLAQLAVQQVRQDGLSAVFVAMRLPYHVQHDEADAQAALDFISPDEVITYNIALAMDAFTAHYRQATGQALTDFTAGNTKARLRMAVHYALAGQRHLLVVGTDHAAESVTGFFTKYGDGAADIMPLSGLNKRRNRQLLQHLGAAHQLWAKAPTADLLDEKVGQTDEEELGIAYATIDAYLEGRQIAEPVAHQIEELWANTRHKRQPPVTLADTWWRQHCQPISVAGHPGHPQTALLVIDMQNAYFEQPQLAAKKDQLVRQVNELISAAHAAGRPVVLVRTEHQPDGCTWTLNMHDDGQGFAYPASVQASFLSQLKTGGHSEVVKTRDSAFHGTNLRQKLGRLGVTQVLICGVSTHSCIAQTATAAYAHNLRAAVACEAIASENTSLSQAMLQFLTQEMRQPLLSQLESLSLLQHAQSLQPHQNSEPSHQ